MPRPTLQPRPRDLVQTMFSGTCGDACEKADRGTGLGGAPSLKACEEKTVLDPHDRHRRFLMWASEFHCIRSTHGTLPPPFAHFPKRSGTFFLIFSLPGASPPSLSLSLAHSPRGLWVLHVIPMICVLSPLLLIPTEARQEAEGRDRCRKRLASVTVIHDSPLG